MYIHAQLCVYQNNKLHLRERHVCPADTVISEGKCYINFVIIQLPLSGLKGQFFLYSLSRVISFQPLTMLSLSFQEIFN